MLNSSVVNSNVPVTPKISTSFLILEAIISESIAAVTGLTVTLENPSFNGSNICCSVDGCTVNSSNIASGTCTRTNPKPEYWSSAV